MTTVHLVGGERVAYVKGAAEVILPRTTLTEEARAAALAAEAAMERDALRVLALARRVLPAGRRRRGGRDRAATSSSSASSA